MKALIKKLWADPVWSKVIAAGIIALIGWLGIHFLPPLKFLLTNPFFVSTILLLFLLLYQFFTQRRLLKQTSASLQSNEQDGQQLLVSNELISASGLTAFFPSRSYYTHRTFAPTIDTYVNTASKSVVVIGVTLSTGVQFDGLCKVLDDKLDGEASSFQVTISLLNPDRTELIAAMAPVFDLTPEHLSSNIKQSLHSLFGFRSRLAVQAQRRFEIRVHNSIPFGSAIMIDHKEPSGRIQIETKPYKERLRNSFAFEIAPFGASGLYQSLVRGYESLLRDGNVVEEKEFFKPVKDN